MSRVFLIREPDNCAPVNVLCEKLDSRGIDYEISYVDTDIEDVSFGYLIQVEWEE